MYRPPAPVPRKLHVDPEKPSWEKEEAENNGND
jgi:hypothetical protein